MMLFAAMFGTAGVRAEETQATPMVVILLGPPGVGKGTQADKLAESTDLPHISTGDLFRANVKQETALGLKAKQFLDQGKLVPDEIVLSMLFERIAQSDCADGYIVDGFPRTLAQAEALQKHLGNVKPIVIDLQAKDETVIERISGRLTCTRCGAVYHRKFSPPKQEGICDKCGGPLVQRKDDSEEIVRERLKVYHEQTQPLEDYYERQGLLRKIDAEQDVDAIHQAILTSLGVSSESEVE